MMVAMTTPSDPKNDAKVQQHFQRTRQAVLAFIASEGGSTRVAAAHDYAESKWFVAHQRFSQLMEGLVNEGLVSFDRGTMTITLTESGRAAASG